MQIKLLTTLRDIADCEEVEMEAKNIRQVINKLIEKYGSEMEEVLLEQGELDENVTILVNRKNIFRLNGLKTELSFDDEIVIFAHILGG